LATGKVICKTDFNESNPLFEEFTRKRKNIKESFQIHQNIVSLGKNHLTKSQ
jgi:hypothetical protein